MFPLTTTMFLVSYPLVMIILMMAAIRMRITNRQAQNATAMHLHQGVLGLAHAVTQMPEAFPLCPPTASHRCCHPLLLYCCCMPKFLTLLTQALPTLKWA